MFTLYGISNCDTVRKARKWLDSQAVDYRFHDFRKDGLSAQDIERWLQQIGPDTLINKRGTTWRQLSDADRQRAETEITALLVDYPALIKRPLLENQAICTVGFNETLYRDLINGVPHE
ncbi:MAG: ArsC family reductase [Nitrincola lacisaponensis]|uniref:ArsC family reductase n=1 Tax=Nitrincola lacisaponensis TaxID=267850 RepID=UPI003918B1B2